MSGEENKFHHLNSAVESLTSQIELLSSKCKMEDNKKNVDFDKIIEASSLMLQLSRTLNELLITRNFLESSKGNPIDFLNSMMNGRNI